MEQPQSPPTNDSNNIVYIKKGKRFPSSSLGAGSSQLKLHKVVLEAILALLFFYALGCLFYLDDIVNANIPIARDLALIILPTEYLVRNLAWPALWNDFAVLGKPLLADPQALVLNPLAFLGRFIDLPQGFSVSLAINHIIACFGLYLLIRRQVSYTAALLGATAFGFGGLLLSADIYPNALYSWSSLPWVLLAGEALCRKVTFARIFLFSLSALLMVLGGMPEAFAVALFLIGLRIILLEKISVLDRFSKLSAIAVGVAIAFCLGAIQFIPSLEFLGQSSRSSGLRVDDVLRFSLEPESLVHFFIPRVYDPTQSLSKYIIEGQLPWALSLYLGPLLLLVPLAIRRIRLPVRIVGGLFLIAMVLLTMGSHFSVIVWLVEKVPLLQVIRYPEKLLIVPHLIFSILMAIAVDRARFAFSPRFAAWGMLVAIAAAVYFSYWIIFGMGEHVEKIWLQNVYLQIVLFFLMSSGCFFYQTRRFFPAFGLGLFILGTFWAHANFIPKISWTTLVEPPQILQQQDLKIVYSNVNQCHPQLAETECVSFLKEHLASSLGAFWGVRNINAPASINLREHEKLHQSLETAGIEARTTLLRQIGVKAVISAQEIRLMTGSGRNSQLIKASLVNDKIKVYSLPSPAPFWSINGATVINVDNGALITNVDSLMRNVDLRVLRTPYPGWFLNVYGQDIKEGLVLEPQSHSATIQHYQIPASSNFATTHFASFSFYLGMVLSVVTLIVVLITCMISSARSLLKR